MGEHEERAVDDLGPASVDRRRLIATGVAVGAAAWVTPAVIMTDVAQAQGTPQVVDGSLSGVVGDCSTQFPLDPGQQFEVVAEAVIGGATFTTTTPVGPGLGTYLLSLPPGDYDVYFQDLSGGSQEFAGTVTITSGTTTFRNHAYQDNGCN